MSELITEKIEETEQIVEKMVEDVEQIDSSSEIISEIMPEKRRYRGQRGRDRNPRRINQNSMMNLKPYRNEITNEDYTNTQILDKKIWVIGIIGFLIMISVIIWIVVKRIHKNSLYVE